MEAWRTDHGVELGVVGLGDAQDVGGVHHFNREAGQPAGDAGAWKDGSFMVISKGFSCDYIYDSYCNK